MSNSQKSPTSKYTKHIDNCNFIEHIVSIKCIRCGEFFEPDKTKQINPVCNTCKVEKIQVNEFTGEKLSSAERKRRYQKEYMKNYWRKRRNKP